jgi:hypothetical protein
LEIIKIKELKMKNKVEKAGWAAAGVLALALAGVFGQHVKDKMDNSRTCPVPVDSMSDCTAAVVAESAKKQNDAILSQQSQFIKTERGFVGQVDEFSPGVSSRLPTPKF